MIKATNIRINALVVASPGNGSSNVSKNDFSSVSSSSASSDTIVLNDSVPLLEDTRIIDSSFVVAYPDVKPSATKLDNAKLLLSLSIIP